MSIFDKFKKNEEKDSTKVVEKEVVSDKTAKVDSGEKNNEVKKEDKTDKKPKVKKEAKNDKNNNVYGILVRPLITEKASNMGQINKYIFEVAPKANKIQITQAIESRYGVKPIKINVINNSGRNVRFGRNLGKTKGWRKAIITLPEGKSIEINEGV